MLLLRRNNPGDPELRSCDDEERLTAESTVNRFGLGARGGQLTLTGVSGDVGGFMELLRDLASSRIDRNDRTIMLSDNCSPLVGDSSRWELVSIDEELLLIAADIRPTGRKLTTNKKKNQNFINFPFSKATKLVKK